MSAIILRADARQLPLPDNSVDLIVTSPPYFALRSYQDDGQHYDGQIGSETTPDQYLDVMVGCVREWTRVLKPSGSMFINMGDKYAGGAWENKNGHGATGLRDFGPKTRLQRGQTRNRVIDTATRPKSLLGVPWRLALRCIDDLNLILRAEIIWSKPNGLPESVTDRVRRSHEQIFHFTMQPRYYSAVDEVREEQEYPHHPQIGKNNHLSAKRRAAEDQTFTYASSSATRTINPLGKLPGSVWTIPSAPLTVPEHLGVDHFAAYPPDLIRPIILGWSPPGICVECGEGRRPEVCRATMRRHNNGKYEYQRYSPDNKHGSGATTLRYVPDYRITGYMCACPNPTAPTRRSVVLDPFGGTGTTALVASTHGRLGISVDLSHDYSRLAQWRTHDPGERARALKVEKPPPVSDGQLGMFEAIQ